MIRLVYCTLCHKTHGATPGEKPCENGQWLDPEPIVLEDGEHRPRVTSAGPSADAWRQTALGYLETLQGIRAVLGVDIGDTAYNRDLVEHVRAVKERADRRSAPPKRAMAPYRASFHVAGRDVPCWYFVCCAPGPFGTRSAMDASHCRGIDVESAACPVCKRVWQRPEGKAPNGMGHDTADGFLPECRDPWHQNPTRDAPCGACGEVIKPLQFARDLQQRTLVLRAIRRTAVQLEEVSLDAPTWTPDEQRAFSDLYVRFLDLVTGFPKPEDPWALSDWYAKDGSTLGPVVPHP
jgi:hypothetical protein